MIGLFVDTSMKRPIIVLSSFEWDKLCVDGASCQAVGTLGVSAVIIVRPTLCVQLNLTSSLSGKVRVINAFFEFVHDLTAHNEVDTRPSTLARRGYWYPHPRLASLTSKPVDQGHSRVFLFSAHP